MIDPYILHQGRALLGDEMGLGKTVQAIATMVSLRNIGGTHFCVVCPASVISNWCREIRKHSLLSVTSVHGRDREEALASWIRTGGVMVTTFETTDVIHFQNNFQYKLLIVDEAHYIKNPEAARSKNVKRIGQSAERMLFLTGTALENNVSEMVQLLHILNPAVANAVRGIEALSDAPHFREKIAPVYYRRKREDVLKELPELIENEEWCTLGRKEEALYEKAVLHKKYVDARRVSWNVDDLSASSKASRMLEIVADAKAEGRKIIVFSFFLDTISKISKLLGDQCMQPINGSVSTERRQEIIDEFDKAPDGTVLAAQIQSGGTGLNIQSASVVIMCEPQFKPSIENQAISRAYRMGQTRNVLVYRLLCENTVDERIMEMLHDKQEIFDAFADQSVAAAETKEMDNKTFGKIIEEEIERINAKNGKRTTEDELPQDLRRKEMFNGDIEFSSNKTEVSATPSRKNESFTIVENSVESDNHASTSNDTYGQGLKNEEDSLTEDKKEEAEKIWSKWDPSIHEHPDQIARRKRACEDKCTPMLINKIDLYGYFIGSGRYETFLDICDCLDFSRRKLPCKHMYRLAMELGVINDKYSTSKARVKTRISTEGMPFSEVITVVEGLPESAQQIIYQYLTNFYSKGIHQLAVEKSETTELLQQLNIMQVPEFPSYDLLLGKQGKNKVVSGLKKLHILYSQNLKKDKLYEWIVKEHEDIIPDICNGWVLLNMTKEYEASQRELRSYLKNKLNPEMTLDFDSTGDYVGTLAEIPDPTRIINKDIRIDKSIEEAARHKTQTENNTPQKDKHIIETVSSVKNAYGSTRMIDCNSYDFALDYLSGQNYEFVDKTGKKGALYFYSDEARAVLSNYGYHVLRAANGTKGTKGRPAWYIKI